MKVGITELVLGRMPIPEFFKTVRDAGFETTELGLSPSTEAPLNYTTTDEELKSFRQLGQENQVPVDSIVLTCGHGSLVLPPAEAKDAIAETAWGLECAAKLGATVALHVVGSFPMPENLYYEEAYYNAIINLKTLVPVCEKVGVSLAFEFVGNGFLYSPMETRNFLDTINSPYVGFYFDTGNMAVYQYPQHWARALARHIKRVHVKDFLGRPGDYSRPGLLKGTVNFPAIMAELRKAGYDGPLTSEVDINEQSLPEMAEAIRKIIAM